MRCDTTFTDNILHALIIGLPCVILCLAFIYLYSCQSVPKDEKEPIPRCLWDQPRIVRDGQVIVAIP
jgi:hypothetical protein